MNHAPRAVLMGRILRGSAEKGKNAAGLPLTARRQRLDLAGQGFSVAPAAAEFAHPHRPTRWPAQVRRREAQVTQAAVQVPRSMTSLRNPTARKACFSRRLVRQPVCRLVEQRIDVHTQAVGQRINNCQRWIGLAGLCRRQHRRKDPDPRGGGFPHRRAELQTGRLSAPGDLGLSVEVAPVLNAVASVDGAAD